MSQEHENGEDGREQGNGEEENNSDEEEQAKSQVFRKLPHSLSIREKVELIVKLHDNNYFLDKSEAELKKVDKRIRPLQKVTKKHLDAIRPTKGLNAKLSWVMQNKDKPFARALIDNLENETFTSIIKVQHAARDLFKSPAAREYGAEYRSNQATHSTQVVGGQKTRVVTKRDEARSETSSVSDQNQLEQFIERAKEKLKDKTTLEMIEAHSVKNTGQRQADINANSESIIFAKEAAGRDTSSAARKLTITTIALVHEILQSVGLED